MKSFLGTFVISNKPYTVLSCPFFGGYLIFKNIWAILVLVAFIIAVLITAFAHQENKNRRIGSTN
ncbi:MAG: hypothetical protein GX625_16570 [Clostridiaceae bacterium]|nr:hypothetical protein [Clostridiaceae bacterium]